MNGRIVFGILFALLLVASVLGASAYAYNIGVAQGLADSGKLVAPATGVAPHPYFYGRWGFHPFGFLSCLVPLFAIFILFSVIRMVFWRGHWGGMHHRKWEGGVPPMAEEWHRKMHEQQQAAQK
jgi:hypothetical protein